MYLICIRFTCFFFFNDTATTEIYTLSLHDALPIFHGVLDQFPGSAPDHPLQILVRRERSEEHTSELQSQSNLVCRLLLEKKNIKIIIINMQLNMKQILHNYSVIKLNRHKTR